MQINESAEALFDFLDAHNKVKEVWYPKNKTVENYAKVKREGGGYGGLMSVVLHGGEKSAAAFYDSLRVSKGPSLGTVYTMACPYTLLAHFNEIPWAEKRGVSRDLIRIWVGLEDTEGLIGRFADALNFVE